LTESAASRVRSSDSGNDSLPLIITITLGTMAKKKAPFDEFERIVQTLLRQKLDVLELGTPVTVERDSKIRGVSGYEHQIDVSFSCRILGVKLIFIVECKYYSRKVSVEDLLAFKSRIDDIRAHKGIFVTTVGYQRGAYTFAKENGIALVIVRGVTWTGISERPAPDATIAHNHLSSLVSDFSEYNGGIAPEVEVGIKPSTEIINSEQEIPQVRDIGFFFRRRNQEIVFGARELSIGKAKICCDYTLGAEIVLEVDGKSTLPSKCLVKYLICRELCKP
jgi:hypothetical protein